MSKRYPYSRWCKRDNLAMGRMIGKTEIIQYFNIIKEKNDLRAFCEKTIKLLSTEATRMEILTHYKYNYPDPKLYRGKGEKKDLFGFMDFLVIDPNVGAIAIQVTGQSGHARHRKEILRNVNAQRWINFHPIELWSYRKLKKKRGGKQKIWKSRVENLTMDMFIESADQMRLFEKGASDDTP